MIKSFKKSLVLFMIATLGLICFVVILFAVNGSISTVKAAEEAKNISVLEGASIRLNSYSGIRFSGKVNKKYYDELQSSNKKVGMLLIPESKVESELTINTNDVLDCVCKVFSSKSTDTEYVFNVVLTNLPTKLYATKLVARAYVYDGSSYTYSADSVTRSIAQVANLALSTDSESYSTDEQESLKKYIDDAEINLTINNKLYLVPGQDNQIAFDADGFSVKFTSNDPSIATVDENGLVHPVSKGSTTITAEVGKTIKTINVCFVDTVSYQLDRVDEANSTQTKTLYIRGKDGNYLCNALGNQYKDTYGNWEEMPVVDLGNGAGIFYNGEKLTNKVNAFQFCAFYIQGLNPVSGDVITVKQGTAILSKQTANSVFVIDKDYNFLFDGTTWRFAKNLEIDLTAGAQGIDTQRTDSTKLSLKGVVYLGPPDGHDRRVDTYNANETIPQITSSYIYGGVTVNGENADVSFIGMEYNAFAIKSATSFNKGDVLVLKKNTVLKSKTNVNVCWVIDKDYRYIFDGTNWRFPKSFAIDLTAGTQGIDKDRTDSTQLSLKGVVYLGPPEGHDRRADTYNSNETIPQIDTYLNGGVTVNGENANVSFIGMDYNAFAIKSATSFNKGDVLVLKKDTVLKSKLNANVCWIIDKDYEYVLKDNGTWSKNPTEEEKISSLFVDPNTAGDSKTVYIRADKALSNAASYSRTVDTYGNWESINVLHASYTLNGESYTPSGVSGFQYCLFYISLKESVNSGDKLVIKAGSKYISKSNPNKVYVIDNDYTFIYTASGWKRYVEVELSTINDGKPNKDIYLNGIENGSRLNFYEVSNAGDWASFTFSGSKPKLNGIEFNPTVQNCINDVNLKYDVILGGYDKNNVNNLTTLTIPKGFTFQSSRGYFVVKEDTIYTFVENTGWQLSKDFSIEGVNASTKTQSNIVYLLEDANMWKDVSGTYGLEKPMSLLSTVKSYPSYEDALENTNGVNLSGVSFNVAGWDNVFYINNLGTAEVGRTIVFPTGTIFSTGKYLYKTTEEAMICYVAYNEETYGWVMVPTQEQVFKLGNFGSVPGVAQQGYADAGFNYILLDQNYNTIGTTPESVDGFKNIINGLYDKYGLNTIAMVFANIDGYKSSVNKNIHTVGYQGKYYWDEVSADDITALASYLDAFNALNPGCTFMNSVYPMYHSDFDDESDYIDYIDNYINNILSEVKGNKVLSSAVYAILGNSMKGSEVDIDDNGIFDGYLRNYEIFVQAIKESNLDISFEPFILGSDIYDDKKEVYAIDSQADILLQYNVALAYGAKGLWNYAYKDTSDGVVKNAVLDKDGNLQNETLYNYLKTANSYLLAFADIYMNYNYVGTGFVNNTYSAEFDSLDGYEDYAMIDSISCLEDALIGEFSDGEKFAYVVTNYSLTEENSVEITFENEVSGYYFLNGVKTEYSSNLLTIELGAGEAAFVVLY